MIFIFHFETVLSSYKKQKATGALIRLYFLQNLVLYLHSATFVFLLFIYILPAIILPLVLTPCSPSHAFGSLGAFEMFLLRIRTKLGLYITTTLPLLHHLNINHSVVAVVSCKFYFSQIFGQQEIKQLCLFKHVWYPKIFY